MIIIKDLSNWKVIRAKQLHTIGFVATMGNLHQGHLSLCQASLRSNDKTIVSIFVNPTQFNDNLDFDKYPRTLEQDLTLLEKYNIDYVFLPDRDLLYPDEFQLQIHETHLSKELEGQFRPGHFIGMLTIVLKLLNIIQPTAAYFGEKDFQQLLLIKKMADALFLPTEIVACATVREKDGLAMSSRNNRLNPRQRLQAAHFSRLLQSSRNVEHISAELETLGFKIDYIVEKWQRRLGAVWLDDIRLIDNVLLNDLQ